MRSYFSATFASLSVRNYRLFFFGQAVSVTGSWMQKLALSWLVLELTNSGTWLGIVFAVTQLPTLLFGSWAGVLADQHDKRKILLGVAAAGAVPSAVLGALATWSHVHVPMLILIAWTAGCIDALEKPTRQSFPVEMVGRALLSNAVTLNQVIQDIGKSVGPAIAALLIAGVGVGPTFLVNSATYLVVILGLLMMRPSELHRTEREHRGSGKLRAGFAYVRREPQLLGPILLLFVAGLMAYNFQVMLPLLAKQGFNGDARQAGYLLAALGLGSVVGGLAIASILAPSTNRIVVSALLLGGLMGLVAMTPTFWLAVAAMFLVGVSSVLFKALASSWLQLTATPVMRGRVVSLLVIAIAGTTPIGGPLLGWLSTQVGSQMTFLIAGVCVAVAACVTYAYLRSRHGSDDPRQPEKEPSLGLTLPPRSTQ